MKTKKIENKDIEKKIDSVFNRRKNSLKLFSSVRRIPKQIHFAIETRSCQKHK
jgi:hypothetical protein